ncbi:MAG: hypothetical protein GY720_06040 [bacterium]|nr:hypothetical protein [bacterium]
MPKRRKPPPELVAAAKRGPAAAVQMVTERGGGPLQDRASTTFVYVGKAETIELTHWMNIFPTVPPFARIDNTDVWWTTVELPEAARVEYRLTVQRDDRLRLVPDPLNPQRSAGPFGANSVATGPDYKRSPHAIAVSGVPSGQVVDLPVVSGVFGETRTTKLYLPAGYAGEPVALVVVHDGSDYLNFAALGTVLDNLNTTTSVAALMVNPDDRMVEYGADARHAEHLICEALPTAGEGVTISKVIGLGTSFGGVAALHAAWQYPGTFSALVLQSGSFVEATGGPFGRDERFAPVLEFMGELWEEPGDLPARMHLSCGQFDGLIGDNRRMVERLRGLGIEVGWDEAPDGHHWGLWRDSLGPGLSFALSSFEPAERSPSAER